MTIVNKNQQKEEIFILTNNSNLKTTTLNVDIKKKIWIILQNANYLQVLSNISIHA